MHGVLWDVGEEQDEHEILNEIDSKQGSERNVLSYNCGETFSNTIKSVV